MNYLNMTKIGNTWEILVITDKNKVQRMNVTNEECMEVLEKVRKNIKKQMKESDDATDTEMEEVSEHVVNVKKEMNEEIVGEEKVEKMKEKRQKKQTLTKKKEKKTQWHSNTNCVEELCDNKTTRGKERCKRHEYEYALAEGKKGCMSDGKRKCYNNLYENVEGIKMCKKHYDDKNLIEKTKSKKNSKVESERICSNELIESSDSNRESEDENEQQTKDSNTDGEKRNSEEMRDFDAEMDAEIDAEVDKVLNEMN